MSNLLYSDFDKTVSDAKSRSVGALFGFSEYLSNAIVKARDFLREDLNGEMYTTISKQLTDSKAVVLTLSKTQYLNALNNQDGVTQLKNSAGEDVEMLNEEIIDLYQDSISEICIQKEYVQCCLTGVVFSATDLVTRVKGLYPGIEGSLLEKYSSLIDNSSLLSSIENLFQFGKLTTVEEENNVLVIKSAQGYTGVNVWEAAFKQIGDTITGFFVNVVWKGITKIGQFLESIWNAIKELGLWIVGKVAKQYMTNYTKVSGSCGIMDYPIMQFYLGTVVESSGTGYEWILDVDKDGTNWFEICKSVEQAILSTLHIDLTHLDTMYLYKEGCRDYFTITTNQAYPGPTGAAQGGKFTRIMGVIYNLIGVLIEKGLRYQDEEGNWHLRALDVIVPTSTIQDVYSSSRNTPWLSSLNTQDVLLRLGPDENNKIFLQLFVMDTYENHSQYSDLANANRIAGTVNTLNRALGNSYNCLFGDTQSVPLHNSDTSLISTNARIGFSSLVFLNTPTGDEGPYDLVANLRLLDGFAYAKDHTSTDGYVYYGNWHHGFAFASTLELILGAVQYMIMNSGVRDVLGSAAQTDNMSHCLIRSSINTWQFLSSDSGLYNKAGMLYLQITDKIGSKEPGSGMVNFDYNNNYNNFITVGKSYFVPYNVTNLTPVSIHYQNIDERASEISKGIWTILIATAIAIVAYKTLKFIKNRKRTTYLAKNAMDKLSWDVAADASPENVAKFDAARNKYRKMNRMNMLLGLSADAASDAVFNSSDMVLSAIKGLKSDESSSTNNSITLTTIHKLITG